MQISAIASELAGRVPSVIKLFYILVRALLDLGRTKRYSYHYKSCQKGNCQYQTGAVANDLTNSTLRSA